MSGDGFIRATCFSQASFTIEKVGASPFLKKDFMKIYLKRFNSVVL